MCDVTNPTLIPYPAPGIPMSGRVVRVQPDGSVTESMLIPPSTRDCAMFVYARLDKDRALPVGTAFTISHPIVNTEHEFITIITARHVIEQIRAAGGDTVWLRVNVDDDPDWKWFPVPLSEWLFHPNDSELTGRLWLKPDDRVTRYDVAVAPCPPSIASLRSLRQIPESMLVDDQMVADKGIVAGDEVAITGLYRQHYKTRRNIPIVRSGMIAAMPEEPVNSGLGPMRAYLIETRSTNGLSGSPVFWLSGWLLPTDDASGTWTLRKIELRLLGMIQGHFDSRIDSEKLNDGIATVLPASTIAETFEQEALMARRRAHEDRLREQESGPTLDSLLPPAPSGGGEDRVSLAGVDPEDALRALLRTPPHGQPQDPA